MSTKEEDNFLRSVYLNYRVATTALRRYFDGKHPNLASDLSSSYALLHKLYKPPKGQSKILYPAQWNLLYPSNGSTAVSSADFDVTLMVFLLRNLPPTIPQPNTGFDVLPPSNDASDGAHIARIKFYKNSLVSHSKDGKLAESDFITIWSDLTMAIHGLGNQQDRKEALEAKHKALDYESMKKLMNLDEIIYKRLEDVEDNANVIATKIAKLESIDIQHNRKRLIDHANKLADHNTKIAKLETEIQSVKKDKAAGIYEDWMIAQLQQWNKEDAYFVETTASKHVMRCLLDNKCVSVVGAPGVGKTFLVQHVALEMGKIGFNLKSISDPIEVKKNYTLNEKTLFVVDDMCGNYTANTTRLDLWKNAVKYLNNMLDKDTCKLIITCRLQVFQDEGFTHSNLKLFKTCICNLADVKMALTNSEKDNLARKYFKTKMYEVECLYRYDFFPLLCKLYDTNKDRPTFNLAIFLKDPFDSFKQELDDLFTDCKEGKHKISALLLLVVYNNHLERKVLEGKDDNVKKTLKTILEKCGINERLTCTSLILELNSLTGSYLVNENGFYQTIHDKLFDFLIYYFVTKNEEFIELLIKHADENVIRERFLIIESGTCDFRIRPEYVITIQNDNLHIIQLYTQRVFDDMKKADTIDRYTWSNMNIGTKIFIKTVFSIIEKLHNDEILELIKVSSSLFLLYMFVMDVKDIESYNNCFRFGIIVDNVNLEIFTERILHDMTETKNVSDYRRSKCCRNPKFRTELLNCMKKLSTDKIKELIKSARTSFVQLMFVMKEEDIKQRTFSSSSFYKLYGIVIPKDIIQMYMQRVFKDMSIHTDVPTYISKLRCSSNEDFNTALQRFMNDNLSVRNEDLKSASISFIQVMCILTEEDIKHNSPHVYKRYGFNIPCNARKGYIERVFDDMTRSDNVNKHVKGNRNRTNTIFKTGLLEFIEKLSRSKIQNLIETASYDFLNRLCVLTIDDIKDGDNWDRYGVVIPEEYIQLYIDRWFNGMIKLENCENHLAKNRNTHREKFKISLRSYLKELQEYRIEELIKTASRDFLNKWFVTKNEDIQIQSKKEYEQYGIILQGKHLQMYNERIWMLIKMEKDFMHAIGCNRNTRYVLEYVNQLHISQITDLMKTKSEFCVESFHKIKVDVNNDLEEESSYCQSLDNVIRSILSIKAEFITVPNSCIDQYMDRMVSDWRKGYLFAVIRNVNMKNKSFMERFLVYLNHLEPSIISELVNGVRQNLDSTCYNFRTYHNYSINTITICSERCEVNLAKWCVENHCNGNRYDKHYKLCALFILVVFDNQIKEKALIDEDQKVKDMIMLFGRNHDIHHDHGDIPARLVRDALDSTLNGIVIKKNGVYHVINTSVVEYLFIYFGSIEHLSTILIEYADLNNLYQIFMLDKLDCGRQYLIDLPATNIQRCIERIFESLSRSKQNIKYILGEKYRLKYKCLRNIKAIRTYNGNLKKEAIELLIKDSCIEFLNTFCLVDGTEDDEYSKCYPFILIPGDLITMYMRRLFDNMKISECVEVCLRKNRNKNNRAFHAELSTFFKVMQRDDVEELIAQASSDFISHMLVISEDDIKYENYWEYEKYGIVLPEDMVQIYIERVFFDVIHSKKVLENRNVENKKFQNILHSYAISISEVKVLWLIKTASSTFLSHMFLSTESDVYDLRSQIRECSFKFLSRQFYKTFQQHLSKEKCKKVNSSTHNVTTKIYRFSHNLFTFTSQSSYEKDDLNVFLTGSFKDDKIFDNLHQHPTAQVFTNKTIKLCVSSSPIIVKENIKRMIQDWNDGKVHDVFANINLSNPSFQSEFITYLKNTDGAVQTNLAKTNDIVTGDSPLAVCCYAGIKELAEWCLENNTNTNSINKYGEPPLYIACYHIHPDIVWCLLNHENKADANMKTEVTSITPLYLACEKNLKTIAQHLLKEEVDVNMINDRWKYETSLFVACKYGHIDIVKLLLKLKVDQIDINKGRQSSIYSSINNEKTPLYIACRKGHTEIVSLLLNHTADEVDVNKKTSFKGETPLYVACEGGYNDIVSLLLKHESSGLNKSRFDGATSLFVASQKGYDEVVATLCLQKEIKIDKRMIFGMSPLFIASLLGHTKIVEMLLNRNADANKCVHDKETVEILLNGEKQRSWRQQDLETYINDLREKDSSFDLKLVKFKKEGKGEDRVSNLFFGSSPLHIGCALGHTEIVKLLVDKIYDVNCLNEIGSTPLCLAKDLGHEDIVSILLSKGAKHTLERRARKRKWTPENN